MNIDEFYREQRRQMAKDEIVSFAVLEQLNSALEALLAECDGPQFKRILGEIYNDWCAGDIFICVEPEAKH